MDKVTKAVVAMLIAGLGSAQTALLDGHITAAEWVVVGLTTVTAAGLTWAVPNTSKSAADANASTTTPTP